MAVRRIPTSGWPLATGWSLAVVVITACASPAAHAPKADSQIEPELDSGSQTDSQTGIEIAPEAMYSLSGEKRSPAYTGAWLAYAAAQAVAYKDLQQRKAGNGTADDFEIEVRARSTMAAYWREQLEANDVPPDPYLAKLVEINDAGFMDEYVIGTFAKPGWAIPSSGLEKIDLPAFWQWAGEHIADLKSPTYARIRTDAPALDEDIPGEDLPDPQQFALDRVPCTESLGPLSDAVENWELRAAGLAGAPVFAQDRRDFNWTLSRIRQMEPYRTKGVTWVSYRPAALAFMTGFCAVDVHDYARAERFLTAAVGMMPLNAMPKLELTQALIAQRKLEQADALVQLVIDTEQDKCEIAHAWRKRGYIRFEQGALEEARSAYKRSLELDPFSQVAISELQLLESEIAAHGGDPEPYVPPPGEQSVSRCQSG